MPARAALLPMTAGRLLQPAARQRARAVPIGRAGRPVERLIWEDAGCQVHLVAVVQLQVGLKLLLLARPQGKLQAQLAGAEWGRAALPGLLGRLRLRADSAQRVLCAAIRLRCLPLCRSACDALCSACLQMVVCGV